MVSDRKRRLSPRRRIMGVEFAHLQERAELLSKALARAHDIRELEDTRGWKAYKNILSEMIMAVDERLDYHQRLSTEERIIALERRSTLRQVVRSIADAENDFGDLKKKLDDVTLKLREARERLGNK